MGLNPALALLQLPELCSEPLQIRELQKFFPQTRVACAFQPTMLSASVSETDTGWTWLCPEVRGKASAGRSSPTTKPALWNGAFDGNGQRWGVSFGSWVG